MPLYFTDKKKRWPPPKPVQYILAVLTLFVAIAVLIGWLYVRFIYTDPASTDNSDNTTPTETTLPDTAYCLIIIEDAGYERFALVKTDPVGEAVSVTALPPTMTVDSGTLSSVLQKYGAARTAKAVSSALEIPTVHFLSFSIADVQNLMTKLGENLQVTLPEEVSYRDENGATVRLAADARALTPKQIAAVIRYTEWKTAENGTNVAADLTVALINQCLRPKRSLKGYFELLSNTAYTHLRIDNYNAYLAGWEHLASVNDGDLAQRTILAPHS